MSEKIVGLHLEKGVSVQTVLHQILERDGVDGLVVAVRINGRWETCWGGSITASSLCMGAMKIMHDVEIDAMEDRNAKPSFPDRPKPQET